MKVKELTRKLVKDPLARNSAIVLAGSMGANVLSYLYHLVMGRLLGPSGYGELSSLLSLLYIFTVPLLVAQTVLVKFVSGFKAAGQIGRAKSLFWQATKLFLIVSALGVQVILLAGPYISSFLHLSGSSLFTLVYALLVVSLLTIATSSMLTGYQKFVWVSVMAVTAVLVKLLLSIPLVAWGVWGVMVAAAAASVVVYALYFIPLRFLLSVRGEPTDVRRRDMFGFAVPTLLTQLGITSLYSTDIILVRHFFSARDAGLYAALAILGKIIFYASSAVPTVLFPVAAERSATGAKTRRLVLSAVAAVGVVSLGLTFVYFLMPGLIIRLLFGTAYTGGESLLGPFAVFLALFSVGNIFATANLAIGKTGIWAIPIIAGAAQIIGIWVFHATITQVIFLNIIVSALFAVGAAAYYLYEKI